MHPFSPQLFQPDQPHPRIFSFAQEWQAADAGTHRPRIPAPPFVDDSRALPPEDKVIELDRLQRFFDHPARFFLQHVLQIDLQPDENPCKDSEPLTLDGLGEWTLRDQLLRSAQRRGMDKIDDRPDALWQARALLPPPPLDLDTFRGQACQINAALSLWRDWEKDTDTPGFTDIDLSIGGYRLRGRLDALWPDGMRLLRAGTMRMHYRLRAWIAYLAYRASEGAGKLWLAGVAKSGLQLYRGEVSQAQAIELLRELLDLYQQGQQQALPFLPDLAERYLLAAAKHDEDRALDAIHFELLNPFKEDERRDPYFNCLLHGEHPLGTSAATSRFCALAAQICAAPLAALELQKLTEA